MSVPATDKIHDLRNGIPAHEWRHPAYATEKVRVFVHGFGDGPEKVLARHKSIKPYIP